MSFKFSFRLFFLLVFIASSVCAQDIHWRKSETAIVLNQKENYAIKHIPNKYDSFNLAISSFQQKLIQKSSNQIIYLPIGDGKLSRFRIQEISNFEKELSDKFPMIKAYQAVGIDMPELTAKMSFGTDGLHAVVYSPNKSTLFIDPIGKDHQRYIAYTKLSVANKPVAFGCQVAGQMKSASKQINFTAKNANDGILRTYRLVVATSGGYSQFHLNNQGVASGASDAVKKAAVLSAINTTMTRVNGVFERDLGVRMLLVANNDQVIFLDTNTDGLSDNDAGAMINQVQEICDNVIGEANYDIGHVFSNGGSGLAGLGVVCRNGRKAQGVTGISVPIGDPYDVDYVSHEIGHQFGANHTQNNSCQRNTLTAVEPGSASTIMGYAGICAPNIQSNSDDHFHTVSIGEMWSYIQTSATCAVETNTGNSAPTANAGNDYTIPKSTPFVLRGTATDTDGMSRLSYNWEQIDHEVGNMPPASTNTQGPMFRSLSSQSSSNRYMPALPTVIGGSTESTWEVVPSVARTMEFAFTVRDNNPGGGNSARDDMVVTVDAAAGPFVVTSQNSNETWVVGSTQTITWDVAGTDGGSVNTPTVNIKLSTDGGSSFPISLASNVSNDGSHTFSVPSIGGDSNQVRVMVEGNNNIFYAVNAANFTIEEFEFALVLDNSRVEICKPDNAVFTFTYKTFLGFNGTTTFSASELPAGLNATFNPASASANNTQVTVTITGASAVATNVYNFTLEGTSGSLNGSSDATLGVFDTNFQTLVLSSPGDGATSVVLSPTLTWQAQSNASDYDVQIATDSAFNNIVLSTTVSNNSYKLSSELNQAVEYFWRVKPTNLCAEGVFSDVFSFTTESCNACNSSGNTSFNTSTTGVIFNTINNPTDTDGNKVSGYSDYTNMTTNVKRDESYDLTVNVNTDGDYEVITNVWIDWNQDCDFDDNNEQYNLGSSENVFDQPTSGSPLTVQVPSNAKLGSTLMRVITRWLITPSSCDTNFDGETEDYTLNVEGATASIEDEVFEGFNLYPNPAQGGFNLQFKTGSSDAVNIRIIDVSGRTILQISYDEVGTKFAENIVLNRVAAGLYLVYIQQGDKRTTRKLIVE